MKPLVGVVCNLVTVISDIAQITGRRGFCTVRCNVCGRVKESRRSMVLQHVASCHDCAVKLRKPHKDYRGVECNWVRVLQPVDPSRATVNSKWEAECLFHGPHCKGTFAVVLQSVLNGSQKSCGCYKLHYHSEHADIAPVRAACNKTTCARGGHTTAARYGGFAAVSAKICSENISKYLTKKRIAVGLPPDSPKSSDYSNWRMALFPKTLSRAIIRIDKRRCAKCGEVDSLSVHHIQRALELYQAGTPELMFDLSNCITLCSHCHMEAHGGSFHSGSTPDFVAWSREYTARRSATATQMLRYQEVVDFIMKRRAQWSAYGARQQAAS